MVVLDTLKTVLIVKFHGFEIVKQETGLSTEVLDNDYIYKRFTIDMLAKGLEQSTIKQYLRQVKRLLEDAGKNYRDITSENIIDYLALYQYHHHTSNSYKSTMQKYFSSFFKWAYRKRHIDEDIMRDIDSIKFEQKRKIRLTDMQIEDIREAATTLREKALLELMLSVGARVSEYASVNISDVDFTTGRVSIYSDKTNNYRTGFINTKAKKALKKYLDSRTDNNDALFVQSRGTNERLSKESIQEVAKNLGKKAGISFVATVHVYRKTFASIQYIKTGDILYVSKMLGHASTDITIKYYLCDDIDLMQAKHNKAA